MYRRHAIMLYLIHMVPRDELKKLILILISPPPNEHRAHPQIRIRLIDHRQAAIHPLLNVAALADQAAILTPVIVHHQLLAVPVDTVTHPLQLVLCPMEQNTVIIHTVSKPCDLGSCNG